jgi:16S rRNA (uracil1498-N3)-methyltransferase
MSEYSRPPIITGVYARFYAPASAGGRTVALPDDEGQHLTRVLRLKIGAPIVVFDGRGHEYDAVVEKAGKSEVLVAVGAARAVREREPRVPITLAQAILKGDKMDDVVRDAVMMGVVAIQPIITERSETTLEVLARGRRRERWQRVAVASAKQCGRAVVPEVIEPVAFEEVVEPGSIGSAFTFVEPAAARKVVPLASLDTTPPREAAIFIGPEGGWTPDEIERAAAVTHLVTLGRITFRADAMAIVALSALFTVWKEF